MRVGYNFLSSKGANEEFHFNRINHYRNGSIGKLITECGNGTFPLESYNIIDLRNRSTCSHYKEKIILSIKGKYF